MCSHIVTVKKKTPAHTHAKHTQVVQSSARMKKLCLWKHTDIPYRVSLCVCVCVCVCVCARARACVRAHLLC